MPRSSSAPVLSLTYHSKGRIQRFRGLTLGERADVIVQLSPYVQQALLQELRLHEIIDLLDHVDMREAERLLSRITNEKRRQRIVARLMGDVKEKMEYFLRFHPQASLSLISFNYVLLSESSMVAKAGEALEAHYEQTGKFPEVLVQYKGMVSGMVSVADLVRAHSTTRLKKFMRPVTTISYQAQVPEIITTLTDHEESMVVVLDHDGSVLGIIYAEATRELFGNLPGETLYDFAGVDDSERPFDPVKKKVLQRYRWLILNLATSFLAGSVVVIFKDTIDSLTILAMYIPIIAGMGGNAATQAFAIMVRGLTLGTISLQTAAPAIWREGVAGALNGVIIGTIVAVISVVWNESVALGLVVGSALILAHIVAGLSGALIPLLIKNLGKDPATLSGIFISTMTDVFGLIFLLGIATIFLV